MRSFHLTPIAVLLLLLTPFLAAADELPRLTGSLTTVDGMKVLSLHGTVEERGFTEGYLCAEQIHELMVGFALDNALVRTPLLWDMVIVPRVRRRVVVPERTRRRLVAVIDGIRARDPSKLYLKDLRRELRVEDLIAAAALPDWLGLMCSSFARWDDSVDNASTLVGRNLDYFGTPALTRHLSVIVNAPDEKGHGWLSLGYPGLAGCITGFSDQGVFVAIHDVLAIGHNKERMTPRIMALEDLIRRLTPDQASARDTSESAAGILREYNFGMAGNCMLAWRGGAVVLEFDGKKTSQGVTIRDPQTDGFIACSNHFRERGEHRPECWRYECIFDQLLAGGPRDLDQAWAVIRGASKSDTLYRLVADLGTGEVRLERRRNPAGPWRREVRFNAWKLLTDADPATRSTTRPVRKPHRKRQRVLW